MDKTPKTGESFDAWLLRYFYYENGYWFDTGVYPAMGHTEAELLEIFKKLKL